MSLVASNAYLLPGCLGAHVTMYRLVLNIDIELELGLCENSQWSHSEFSKILRSRYEKSQD